MFIFFELMLVLTFMGVHIICILFSVCYVYCICSIYLCSHCDWHVIDVWVSCLFSVN